jgi:dethiobiotin synthetase
MNYFVTAIGTDCGKTIVSAIITEALQADYWKPIQSGTETRDSLTVEALLTNDYSLVHPEQYLLQTPVSPHQAANIDGITIKIDNLQLPMTTNNLVIEGAGGVLAPINEEGEFIIDLATKFKAEIILVINNYLGSINHSTLTINEIKRRNLKVKGIIFNGKSNPVSEAFILNYSQYPCLLHVDQHENFTADELRLYAVKLMYQWNR